MQTILGFCQGLGEQSFASGAVWLREGEQTGRLYILIEGCIEILKGEYQVHVATEPGAVFGEIAALLDIPHTATVRTLTPARAYVVSDAGSFLRAQPDLSYWVCKLLAQRLHAVTGYLADLKAQYEDRKDHLGLVDAVLETLLHQQDEGYEPGSVRHPDPKI